MIDPEYKTWLDGLKVGDNVAIRQRHFGGGHMTVARILRETPKQFYTSFGDFRKSDGKIVGAYMDRPEPVTPEIMQAKKDRELREWFRDFRSVTTDLACLRVMKDAHDEWQAKVPKERNA